jgi:hypothetical protein
MKDQFLEQGINMKFCVKLGRNASDPCAVPSKACRREAMKRSWKMTKEVVIQDLTELMKMLQRCGIWCIQIDSRAMVVQLNLDKEQ